LKPTNFFAELKRRKVFRVAIAYAVASWLLIQIATQTFPFFEIPSWAVRLEIGLLALGFFHCADSRLGLRPHAKCSRASPLCRPFTACAAQF
jgi:hypothetical protein